MEDKKPNKGCLLGSENINIVETAEKFKLFKAESPFGHEPGRCPAITRESADGATEKPIGKRGTPRRLSRATAGSSEV